MSRKNSAPSWLDVVAGLLSRQSKQRPPRRIRRLGAERLEGRAVLSVAPVPVDSLDGGESLAQYLAQEQEMGPAIPAELAVTADADVQDFAADYLFGVEQGTGYGEAGAGEGEGSGSGSGSGSPPVEPTIVEPQMTTEGGTVTVSGQITDDGDPSNLSLSLDGGIGSVTLNPDGTFSVEITDSLGNSSFTITVTDADGNATTYTFAY